MSNFVRFDAGMLKLQQMIEWDVFWDTVYMWRYVDNSTKYRFSLPFLVQGSPQHRAALYFGPLVRVADIPGRRALRFAVTDRLAVPSVRLHTDGNRAFPVAAANIWNSLPDDIVSSANLSTFYRQLKTFLFSVSLSDLIL